jgi:hypothetical protein
VTPTDWLALAAAELLVLLVAALLGPRRPTRRPIARTNPGRAGETEGHD